MPTASSAAAIRSVLSELGLEGDLAGAHDGAQQIATSGPALASLNPATGEVIGRVAAADLEVYERVVATAQAGFQKWRAMPAPQRGEIVRQIGEALRGKKEALGRLVSFEVGKVLSEGEGEVQEMIDVADFAVGLSRQLYGLSMHSERPQHRMYEQWHPLGPIGIITAFNFPVAVWAWNAMLAAVCGDSMIWKPSELTPLTAVAVQRILEPIVRTHDIAGVFNMVAGTGATLGEAMAADRRLPLISATGSCRMGRRVASVVHGRLARSLLELGGNNAVLLMPSADLELALRAVAFGAVGTAGQRCTSTRRLIAHRDVYDAFVARLVKAYAAVRIGDPLEARTLMGPLIRESAVETYLAAIERAKAEGGRVLCGGKRLDRAGFYVEPTIVEADESMSIWREETFAPILYVFRARDLDHAMALHNDVEQGLSSAIFTNDLREAEHFLSAKGSDCGIANVNIGTSGAEIGGAFGGEKDTGGGRESGSDSWKAYMRRQTNTINYGTALPLAQGVTFDI
jgi:aldehyde dehydrogenase (NAD+)